MNQREWRLVFMDAYFSVPTKEQVPPSQSRRWGNLLKMIRQYGRSPKDIESFK